MLNEDPFVREHMQESVDGATEIYQAIASNLRRFEPQASNALAAHLNKPVDQLTYTDYARSLAAFIRSEFRIRDGCQMWLSVCPKPSAPIPKSP
jgi:cytochrome c peroxidase